MPLKAAVDAETMFMSSGAVSSSQPPNLMAIFVLHKFNISNWMSGIIFNTASQKASQNCASIHTYTFRSCVWWHVNLDNIDRFKLCMNSMSIFQWPNAEQWKTDGHWSISLQVSNIFSLYLQIFVDWTHGKTSFNYIYRPILEHFIIRNSSAFRKM